MITETRERNLKRLNLKYIHSDGLYWDYDNDIMLRLTPEDVLFLRKYHSNPNIAKNVAKYEERVERKVTRYYQPKRLAPRKHNGYKLVRDQKYNRGNYRTKKSVGNRFGKLVVIGGIVVSLIVGSQLYDLYYGNKSSFENEIITGYTPEYSSNVQDSVPTVEPTFEITISEMPTYQSAPGSRDLETKNIIDEEQQARQDMIRNICDIYQVNYDIVYPRLLELTDNFSSEDYLSGIIDGVTCKGREVVADSEEQLFVYAIRCMKQLPEQMGISQEGLYIDNGYESGDDYCAQIQKVSDVLGVDKHLMYAIVQAECGFNSELFNSRNNPAGIKNGNGNWWVFASKEEGFFELAMEIIKYYGIIGVPVNTLDADTIARIGEIHAPSSDNNDNWLPNVKSILIYAQENSGELFGSEQSNRLSQ